MDAAAVISIIIGGIFGTALLRHSLGSWLAGMLFGYLLARNFRQSEKIDQLERRLRDIEDLVEDVPGETAAVPPQRQEREEVKPEVSSVIQSPEPAPRPVTQSEIRPETPPHRTVPLSPSLEDRLQAKIKAFFTEGNVVLRVGLLVLFFGVAFLLKYAADRNVISIELRLLGVALGGLGLLGFGWRQRLARPSFALLLQGGGIGIMYMTVFAAFKLYHLLPTPLAFALMLGLVATSTALALLQDSSPLALFGAAGGFLAPVLLSTGSGNHVALFSYYALLNTGILAVSWFKAWRSLNLLGFLFTLGIGSVWGLSSYQPQHFATAEPFLILFFLLFNTIGVLFAFRQPPNLRGYVDGTLVFGTPVICFSLQAGMVQDMPHGLAYSALAVSLFYIVLARWLWNKGNERLRQGMRTLTEAFLALGVVFVTLAVPLALSGRWAAVTWAMEGAALTWVGVRQSRFLARSSGFLLQFAAGFCFLNDIHFHAPTPLPILNSGYLGSVIIALAALFSSWQFYKADNLSRCERWNHLPLFFWGCLWWVCAGFAEINRQLVEIGITRYYPYYYEGYAGLVFIGLSCAVMSWLAVRLSWRTAAWPSLILLPFMAAVVLMYWHSANSSRHFFADQGWLAWLIAFGLLHYCLRLGRGLLKKHCLTLNHIGSFLLLTLIVSSETSQFIGRQGVWDDIIWALLPVGMVLLAHNRRLEVYWPLSEYAPAYQKWASGILAALLWCWLISSSFGSPGNAPPLPFIPLINPLELTQLAVMLQLVWWVLRHWPKIKSEPALVAVITGTVFLWLNTVLARAVHHLADIPFDVDRMLASRLYQTSLAILWALLSLALMVTAGRKQSRTVWFAGCVLIGATVLKLFLVDLANSGAVERIVSFISVGLLVIVISYFSPLPPKKEESK